LKFPKINHVHHSNHFKSVINISEPSLYGDGFLLVSKVADNWKKKSQQVPPL
jgi:hypothetical protein